MNTRRLDIWLVSAVVLHLLISIWHGRAHDGGHVALTRAQSAFVYTVIVIGPLAGLAIAFFSSRIGALIIATTMAGSLVFGLINHFLIISPDHVSQVTAQWRPMFTASAVLLVFSETAGTLIGLRVARRTQEVLS